MPPPSRARSRSTVSVGGVPAYRGFMNPWLYEPAGLPVPGELDTTPFGLDANRRNLEVAIDCVYRQRLIPRRFTVDELFDDVTRALG